MVYRVYLIDDTGAESIVLNGRTNRPASWPDEAAAQASIDAWRANAQWNSLRDDWQYRYIIRPDSLTE